MQTQGKDATTRRLMDRIVRLETELKDALFALDGVCDGDFAPDGRTVKVAIQSAKETLFDHTWRQ
jgi:hypothetical protein